jgi:uncharacterized protein (DUF433 family)
LSRRTAHHRKARRVVTDERRMTGAPCYEGTRIPVESVIAFLGRGISDATILKSYPDLTAADIDTARFLAANRHGSDS